MTRHCFSDFWLTKTPLFQHFSNDRNSYSVLITSSFFIVTIIVLLCIFSWEVDTNVASKILVTYMYLLLFIRSLDGDVPRSTSYGVYISQLIRFARVSSHVVDFNARNKGLTAKLLQQGYRYHKLRKTFSKFYRRHYELVSKFNVGLKTLLHQSLSEPEFYGDLVYKFKKNCIW